MNKNIRYLIEKTASNVFGFSFDDYEDDRDIILQQDLVDNIIYKYHPTTKNELIEIIKQCIKENKFGNEDMYYPDLSGIDVSDITDMSELFKNVLLHIEKPIKFDLSGWDMSNVTNMSKMFAWCRLLEELNLSGWDTSNVSNMSQMFNGCNSLKELDVSGWNTLEVTDMSKMFAWCDSLVKLDLSDWNTLKVTDMNDMFFSCKSLEVLEVSDWNVSSVTTMNGMFYECNKSIIPSWYKN